MVPAIVLAAGRSLRMGRSKALLPAGATGVSFLARAAAALDVPIRIVENPRADEGGQLSSVIAGLNVADRPGATAMMILPVDVPLVTASTVRELLDVFARTHAPIVRAVHGGRHGHPVIFGRVVFDELR